MNSMETHRLLVIVEHHTRWHWEAWVDADDDNVLDMASEGMMRVGWDGLTRRAAIRGLRKRIQRRVDRLNSREEIEWTVTT